MNDASKATHNIDTADVNFNRVVSPAPTISSDNPISIPNNELDRITLTATPDSDNRTYQLTAVATDSQSRPVPDIVITWQLPLDQMKALKYFDTTDSSGVSTNTITLYGANHQGVTTHFHVSSMKDSKMLMSNDVIMTFQEYGANNLAATIALTASPDHAVADGLTPVTLTATVRDSEGYLANHSLINWSHAPGEQADLPQPSFSDATGRVIATLTSHNPGPATLTAIAGNALSNTVAVTFTQVVLSGTVPAKIMLSSNTTTAVADGHSPITLTAIVTDSQGQVVPNYRVNWSLAAGEQADLPQPSLTDASGRVTAIITSKTTGSVNLTASAGNVVSNTVALTFTPVVSSGTVPASIMLSSNTTTAVADGHSQITLTAIVTDSQGLMVPNYRVNWSQAPGEQANLPQPSLTDVSGRVTAIITSHTAGSATLTASAGNAVSQPLKLTFTAAVSSGTVPASITLTAIPDNASADGKSPIYVTARVLDAENNPVTGLQLTWTIDTGNTSRFISGVLDHTDADGKVTVQLTDTHEESVRVTARISNIQHSITVYFIAVADTGYVIKYIPDHTTIFDDGSQGVRINLTLIDAKTRNPAPQNIPVSWINHSADKVILDINATYTNQYGETFNNVNPLLTSESKAGLVRIDVYPDVQGSRNNIVIIPLNRSAPLAEPILHNADTIDDRTLTKQDIANGVVLTIPFYNNWKPSDTVTIYWGEYWEEIMADKLFNNQAGQFNVSTEMQPEALNNGVYLIYYTATDAAGNASDSRSLMVTVEADAPQFSLAAPEVYFGNIIAPAGSKINRNKVNMGISYRIPKNALLSSTPPLLHWKISDAQNNELITKDISSQGMSGTIYPLDNDYFMLPGDDGVTGNIKFYYTVTLSSGQIMTSTPWLGQIDTELPH